ncbi:MAG TPA: hypothetical protein VGG74_24815 [Kofleriaceae bacterium]|jgi:hypothetical protein
MDFSSWPRDQEQTFVVYEQHTNDSLKKSVTAGIVAAIALFIVLVGIYAGVEPEHKDMTKDMNMSNLTKKHDAVAPTPPAAPAADKK